MYPAVIIKKNKDIRIKILNDILNNYILKDIKGLLELATEDNLFAIATKLAIQIGNIINYNEISQNTSLNYRNLKKHLKILKETFICEELKPFFTNRSKELSKNPKIYFLDTGFRNSLIDDMRLMEKRQDAGQIAENVIYRRLKELLNEHHKINYWRTKAGAEVDFILRIEDKLIPVEVKYSQIDEMKLSRSFINFINSFKPQRGIIITKNFIGMQKVNGTKVLYMPVYYF